LSVNQQNHSSPVTRHPSRADAPAHVSDELLPICEKLSRGERLTRDDGLLLFRSSDVLGLGALATWQARQKHGQRVCYVVNGHINYSNYCTLSCAFCSFYRRKGKDKRPGGYEMPLEQVLTQADEIAASGATEIHVVGGLHPDFPFSYYVDMLKGIRQKHPKIGLKCFTAIEILHLASTAKLSARETLIALKEAGLDSLPGGGAEVLDDDVRKRICAGKETSVEWLDVHRAAHQLGIPSNATLLYGHVETIEHRVDHLLKLRQLQDETGRFLAFVPLSYHPENNPLKIEHGPSALDSARTCAVSRLLLDNFPHVKAYWITLSVPLAQVMLGYGATDVDGTVLQEKIYHMAGAQSPQSLSAAQLQRLVREAGCEPYERDHLYRAVRRTTPGGREWDVS
jgi:aminodeoxyfutalosine synthase